ncbi:cell wall protein IFF7-like [Teleopsis dalmanni]|uniref:cell wall protein IFF7-like n=1 Tax=Teleopsis dalmanni TaxID=139649 RepID=UPI0018CCF331|nr:cell wall protein IFF7-like [Teleopsis dalmanni]XP_037952097.1 cell wall protein IFF7-like [Teleopsis dalmanni]
MNNELQSMDNTKPEPMDETNGYNVDQSLSETTGTSSVASGTSTETSGASTETSGTSSESSGTSSESSGFLFEVLGTSSKTSGALSEALGTSYEAWSTSSVASDTSSETSDTLSEASDTLSLAINIDDTMNLPSALSILIRKPINEKDANNVGQSLSEAQGTLSKSSGTSSLVQNIDDTMNPSSSESITKQSSKASWVYAEPNGGVPFDIFDLANDLPGLSEDDTRRIHFFGAIENTINYSKEHRIRLTLRRCNRSNI